MKRNKRIFERDRGEEIDHLWDIVCYMASLWASVSPDFSSSLHTLLLDWKAIVLVFCVLFPFIFCGVLCFVVVVRIASFRGQLVLSLYISLSCN